MLEYAAPTPAGTHTPCRRVPRQNCDMPEEMRQDCVDLVITAIERFQGNYEVSVWATLARQAASPHPSP